MHYKEKKKVRELLQVSIDGLVEKNVTRQSKKTMGQIRNSLSLVKEILEKETIRPDNTLDQLSKLQELAAQAYAKEECKELCDNLMQSFDREIEGRFKVVFFPYKASMWDSLETIYLAASKDGSCDVDVVPIPYYQLSENGAKPSYEGDQFPSNISITHYSSYDLEKERPDIIFVHNIYDQYNTLTRVYDQYFTSNLKKYTDMLVYVPYCLFSFVPPKPGSSVETIAYGLPGVANVDRIILLGEYLEKAALKYGVPSDKLLTLGSPKTDKLVRSLRQGVEYPKHWYTKFDNKTVFLLDTQLAFFATTNPLEQLELLIKVLNIPNIIDDSVLIWRPHPLMSTALAKYAPYLLDYYTDLVKRIGENEYSNVVFDDNPDYFPALLAADTYLGTIASLMLQFLISGKKVVMLTPELPEESLVPNTVFYYFRDADWIELLRGFAGGEDPKAPMRRGALDGVFSNIDGTSGEKIFDVIKAQAFGE